MRTRPVRVAAFRLALTVLIAGTPATSARAQMDPTAWKKETEPPAWIRSYPDGPFIMATRGELTSLDPATGEPVWSRKDLGDLGTSSLDPLDGTAYGILRQGGDSAWFTLIDLRTGRSTYRASAAARGYWSLPRAGAALVWDWRIGEKADPNEIGGRMTLIRLEDGVRVWENADFFKEWKADLHGEGLLTRNQAPVMDTDSTMIELMTGTGVRRWHLGTGRLLWATPLRMTSGNPAPFYGFSPMVLDRASGVLYVPGGIGLHAVRTSDGAPAWPERSMLKGIAHRVQVTPSGLLVQGGAQRQPRGTPLRGEPFITLLDPATGKRIWKNEYQNLGPDATNLVVREDKAYVWSNNRITAVSLADGKGSEVAKLPAFQGDDVPTSLQATERGWLLTGNTNVMLVGYDGTVIRHLVHKRPGVGFVQRAVAGVINFGIGQAAANPNDLMHNWAKDANTITTEDMREVERRVARTTQAARHIVMYTEIERDGRKRHGFVRVNGLTGDVQTVITDDLLKTGAFTQKYENVAMAFDAADGRLFYSFETVTGRGRDRRRVAEVGTWAFQP